LDLFGQRAGKAFDVWANLDPNAPPAGGGQDHIDLQTAITHEFGHFSGCATPAWAGRRLVFAVALAPTPAQHHDAI
jgi:hypothetical protein